MKRHYLLCSVLLLASILAVPWTGLRSPSLAVAACGVAGTIYSLIVTRRAQRQREYQPVFEDWLWHAALPALAYVALLVSGVVLERRAGGSLLVIGAAALLLVFVGIHNAWDTVTFMLVQRGARAEARARRAAEVPTGGTPEGRAGATPEARAGAGEAGGSGAASSPAPGAGTRGDAPGPSAHGAE